MFSCQDEIAQVRKRMAAAVLGATEVQSSREIPDLVYTQINEDTSFVRTLRPIRRRDKDDRGRGGAAPLS
jgi:hypothetical protein